MIDFTVHIKRKYLPVFIIEFAKTLTRLLFLEPHQKSLYAQLLISDQIIIQVVQMCFYHSLKS